MGELSDRQIAMLYDVYYERDTLLPFDDWVAFGQLLMRGYIEERFDGMLGLTPRGATVLTDREEHGGDPSTH